MFVIDVIPLSRTAPGVLTYRSRAFVPPGSIVSITIRKTNTQGVVLNCVPVQEAKELLKHARFLLSKSTPSLVGALSPELLRAAESTATYHATTVGAVLAAVFGEYIKLDAPLPVHEIISGSGYVEHIVEAPHEARAVEYRTAVESARACGDIVLLVAPTLPEVLAWKVYFADLDPLVITGAITGARRATLLEKALTHTGVVITTPTFSWIPLPRLSAIIIDRVSAGTYTLPKRPYLSLPRSLTYLATERAVPLYIGDFPVPLELRPVPTAPLKAPLQTKRTLIDARRDPDSQLAEEAWKALPRPVIARIQEQKDAQKPTMVLATRKGYAPTVMCRDCGQAQTDERGVPLMFTASGGVRRFITSDGVTEISAKRKCTRCDSWNLLPLGVGIERVEEELRAAFPDARITTISADTRMAPTKMAAHIASALEEGGILVGTEALLPWLRLVPGLSATLGIIASADSMLALPFWRARERFVRLSCFFGTFVQELLLVTRHPEDTAVVASMHPDSPAFWDEETLLRTALAYPPFGTVMTLTTEGAPEVVERATKGLMTYLAEHTPIELPARPGTAGAAKRVVVLRVAQGLWPTEALRAKLNALPPSVRLRIDPESLW